MTKKMMISSNESGQNYIDADSEIELSEAEELSEQSNDTEEHDDHVETEIVQTPSIQDRAQIHLEPAPRRSQRTRKPKNYGDDFLIYLITSNDLKDPVNAEEALNGQDHRFWTQAMRDEIQSLKKNQTWILDHWSTSCKTRKS